MPYRTIQPPFTLQFPHMSKKELRGYYEWFHHVMSERINELATAVRATPGFEDWRPDRTPKSLNALGHWLAAEVEIRPRTQEEVKEITGRFFTEEMTWDLTNRTFSLALDVGMYLSQVLVHEYPSLKWDQPFGSKRFIDYGQPVLVGFTFTAGATSDDIPFNPVRMIVTLAYGLAKKTRSGESLREIYDIWSKAVK